MNNSDNINAHALLSIVHGCNDLKDLELDDYDLSPFLEKSLHSCMCNVTYIRLFGCTLSDTQVTNLLCEAPQLTKITLWAVKCVADGHCGCYDKEFHGKKQIAGNDLKTLEVNERYYQHRQVSVTTCHIYDSSQVFVHVLQSDSLTTLLIDEYEFSDDPGLEMFIPRCNKLLNLELDNIILDARNIITIIKNSKPGAELQIKLNKMVIGENASHLRDMLYDLPCVDVASFSANDNEIIKASIIVTTPREESGDEIINDDQSSYDEARPLLDQQIENVSDSSEVYFEVMSMSEAKKKNLSCCKCNIQ
ncbi:uncharacterized protein LOC128212261 [Mya arenaria]|uniref:uncharacterized protein LOC128212261 n=1 Tax=Mya arenaria TaxID=6604 RepID=UPI0022E2DBB8|nr:uncharacterized protein LOC128212261 [Mya arenaria]